LSMLSSFLMCPLKGHVLPSLDSLPSILHESHRGSCENLSDVMLLLSLELLHGFLL
jgi:hypothetical protein